MVVSLKDVQSELDAAVAQLKLTNTSYAYMVRTYGKVWTNWPKTSTWYIALSAIAAARAEVGQLQDGHLTADFAVKGA